MICRGRNYSNFLSSPRPTRDQFMADRKHYMSVSRLMFHIWGAQGDAGDAVWSCLWSLAPRAQAKAFWVSCVRNWRRCLPCIVPHHTRQRARENLESSSASGQTHSWLHDLQFAWTIPSFWNYFCVRKKKLYFSLWSLSIYFSATWTFSGGFLVSGRARNIISTDNKKGRSRWAQEKLYGVFTKGGQKDDISVYRNAAVTSTLWRLWVIVLWQKGQKPAMMYSRDNLGGKPKIILWGP